MTAGSTSGEEAEGALSAQERLFSAALEQPAGARRDRWLERATGQDPELARQVRELLEAHEASGDFLETAAALPPSEHDLSVGMTLGAYTLTEELGEGGFGVVFKAHQAHPIRRDVAVKVIKLGMDTRQVIARFEAERQALALMEHPSIARVLDAGSTERGRPYFVMDLAPGQPITAFCDGRRLSVRERLEVFLELCGAVHHAHQRGVIHRDLKPNNVLVQEVEGRALPKVIDFGIAKATSAQLGAGTLFTEMGQVIGTPVYMSPEQATGSTDIDVRADVYSLGVVLHELLVGEPPFSIDELREHVSTGDVGTFLMEQSPTPMSVRVGTAAGDAADPARLRRTTAGDLRRLLRGDLESVVRCALAPERELRYESVAALARDVERVLADRPIEATPPSLTYRGLKFLRRHRVAAAAAVAVLAAVLFGLTVAIQSLRARQDQALVLREIFSATRTAADLAEASDALGTADPERLDRMVRRAFGASDTIRVDALATLSLRLVDAGELGAAIEAQRQALEAARQISGLRSAEAVRQLANLGLLRARGGDPAMAEADLRAAVELDRELGLAPSTVLHAARIKLARELDESGRRREAIDLLEEADRIAAGVEAGDGTLRIEALELLVDLSRRESALEDTRRYFESLLVQYDRRYASGSSYLVSLYVEYARWLASVGLTEDASLPLDIALESLDRTAAPPLALLHETIASQNRVYAQDPSLVTDAAARASLERELTVAQELFAPDATEFLETLARCAAGFERRGDLGRSTELLNERFERFEASSGENQDAAATQRARTVLAEQLLERADAVRRQADLPLDAYRAARRSGELAAPYFPGNRNLLESRVVLATRTGDFGRMVQLLQEFERSSGVTGAHPLTLAMQAIALHQTPATQRVARQTLSRAQDLARRPEFVALPGLQEALDWAAEVIYGDA